jgi:hypothetical protein
VHALTTIYIGYRTNSIFLNLIAGIGRAKDVVGCAEGFGCVSLGVDEAFESFVRFITR